MCHVSHLISRRHITGNRVYVSEAPGALVEHHDMAGRAQIRLKVGYGLTVLPYSGHKISNSSGLDLAAWAYANRIVAYLLWR